MIPCPRCKNPLLIDQSLAGQVVACPYCGQQINVNWPVSVPSVTVPYSPPPAKSKRSNAGTIFALVALSALALLATCCGGWVVLNSAVDAEALKTSPQEFQCPPGLTAEETQALVVGGIQRELGPLVTVTLDEPMSVAIMSADSIYIATGKATAKRGNYHDMPFKYRAVITRYDPKEAWYMGTVTIEKR